jgi:hypothetical protein
MGTAVSASSSAAAAGDYSTLRAKSESIATAIGAETLQRGGELPHAALRFVKT